MTRQAAPEAPAREAPARIDPRTAYPQPPFPKPSGDQSSSSELEPRPDHGEDSYVGSGRLAGLRTLITGGDRGIGRAAAIAFAREGADVAIAYHQERADAEDTLRHIKDAGVRGLAVGGDLSKEGECQALIAEVVDTFGGIDVLVNNAATQRRRDAIEDISTEEWERILRTNLTGPFWLCREAAAHMEPGSSIINVASIQASKPSPSLLAYATTKGGLVTFSKALSEMLAGKGIRVNVVAPGPVWTPLVTSTTDPDEVTTFGGGTLLGRPAQPAELAGAFVFLASRDASFVTGEVIAVTGGEVFS
jgi:NAD(P)-dependent dehydrogenase (short-subunit alcohol dehydrogenase family)